MMNFKKILALVLVVALSVGAGIMGTLAYLQDTDSDVNVMTLGNVSIEQLEFERVVENGAWVSTGETDKYGYTPDKLQPYTQTKPLLPAVFSDGNIKWDDRSNGNHQQSWAQIGAPGSNQLFDDSVKNVQDKFVFVKNTGLTGAYVRTIIALEQGDIPADEFPNVVMTNTNPNHWSWETVATDVEIAGNEYYVICATYTGPSSNPTGILAPGATSYASLLQVYMRPEADNEDCKAIDGNNSGTYDILVLSQAVQASGFKNATEALDTAFGKASEKAAEWLTGDPNFSVVSNEAELIAALEKGGTIIFKDDIALTATLSGENPYVIAKDTSLLLYGHTLNAGFEINEGVSLYLKDGTITNTNNGISALESYGHLVLDNMTVSSARHTVYVHGGTAEINGGHYFAAPHSKTTTQVVYVKGGLVTINGGVFEGPRGWPVKDSGAAVYVRNADATVIINGGSFSRGVNSTLMNNGTLLINGGDFDQNPSAYVAAGHTVTLTDGLWVVE